jgi:phosphoenolpyruvate-protein phosphotransferase (PTS system enzyme I)
MKLKRQTRLQDYLNADSTSDSMETNTTIKKEVVLKGLAAAPGITIGPAYLFKKEVPRVVQWSIESDAVDHEIERLDRAFAKSEKELNKILVFAQQKIGETKAKIFEAQIMVLQDEFLRKAVRDRIRIELKNADYLIDDEIGKYAKMMLAAPGDYMHERAQEMEDLKFRIIRNLQEEKLLSKLEGEMIIISHTLTPADTMILSRNRVLGYATDLGGITSHAAILSCSLKIPAVVGLSDLTRVAMTGDLLILDGYSGTVIVHPTPDRVQLYEQKREHYREFEAQLTTLKDLPAVTTDGHTVELSANIEFPGEIEYVVIQGSQGIGLYRSESLLINKDDFPSEEEQFKEYKIVADRIYPHRVIMRTFDVGGDKIAPEMAEEDNPFLGWRGIRMMLDRPDLFMNQLRAMLRASRRKNISIMFPMITNIGEVRKAKEYVRMAKEELRAKKIRFDDKVPVGVMIEVPAAALAIDDIAKEVDFLSIGSNDLTQYLLAVDRNNTLVTNLYSEFEHVVLSTLKHIIDAGKQHKRWVGLCGELASNPIAIPLLVGLGINELSVIPSLLPEIKKIIRSLSLKDLNLLAEKALKMDSKDDVEQLLVSFMRENLPDIPLPDYDTNRT